MTDPAFAAAYGYGLLVTVVLIGAFLALAWALCRASALGNAQDEEDEPWVM